RRCRISTRSASRCANANNSSGVDEGSPFIWLATSVVDGRYSASAPVGFGHHRGRTFEPPGEWTTTGRLAQPPWCSGCLVDILPVMNDQDSNRSPEGNVLRFALHRQDQNSQVSTRCHGMPCRSSLQVLPNSVGLGYRPTRLNVNPSTDRRKGFLPALHDRVFTLGVR